MDMISVGCVMMDEMIWRFSNPARLAGGELTSGFHRSVFYRLILPFKRVILHPIFSASYLTNFTYYGAFNSPT